MRDCSFTFIGSEPSRTQPVCETSGVFGEYFSPLSFLWGFPVDKTDAVEHVSNVLLRCFICLGTN
ncbi:hypothetical protein THF5G08_230064 [Vibrio jasicida]|nr:hypothetical protein THF5G08_230064 [Vibrio jasicida]